MCGRFNLYTSAQTLARWFEGVTIPNLFPRYNIAPTQDVLSVRLDEQGMTEAGFLRWGLIPSWATDVKIGAKMINARSETASTKPAFRRAFKQRRCLIVADGFYEWKNLETGKQPYLVQPARQYRELSPFLCFAGLWERWIPPTVEPATGLSVVSPQLNLFDKQTNDVEHATLPLQAIESCSILTTSANPFMATIHDRMPVILNRQGQQAWLQADSELEFLQSLLQPAPADLLEMHPVSARVNKASYDRIDCMALADPQR